MSVEQVGVVVGRTTVLTISPRILPREDPRASTAGRDVVSGAAGQAGALALAGLHQEERLLLGLVDGRLSAARIARLSGLSEEAAIRHLQALCDRGVLVPVERNEVTIRAQSGEPSFRLGPYEVTSRIGQGGMGSVYACRRAGAAGFKRVFALKVIRQGSGLEDIAERSFLREIRVGSLLEHPNVQSVFDVGMYKNQPFLVMQYIDGTSLEDVSFGKRVPPEMLVAILIDVLRGLQYAHELSDEGGRRLGLVHGDVSPPNILIGIDGVARLMDFGTARFTALGEGDNLGAVTLGKPAYMAPEQITKGRLDGRADLFAMGVVLWTGLTGRELFAGNSFEEILDNVLSKKIEPPSVYGGPPCLDEICMRALSRSPEGRPSSAEQMAQVLLRASLANALLASPADVGAFIERQTSDAEVGRRRLLRAPTASPALTSPVVTVVPGSSPVGAAPVSASAAAPGAAPTPVTPLRAPNPTVILPSAQQPRTHKTFSLSRRQQKMLLVSVGSALGIVLIVLTAALAMRHRHHPSVAAPTSLPPASASR